MIGALHSSTIHYARQFFKKEKAASFLALTKGIEMSGLGAEAGEGGEVNGSAWIMRKLIW